MKGREIGSLLNNSPMFSVHKIKLCLFNYTMEGEYIYYAGEDGSS